MSGFSHFDRSCVDDLSSTPGVAFLDEFVEMGNVPRALLTTAEIGQFESIMAAKINVQGATSQVLYAPQTGAGPAPLIPEVSALSGRLRNRRRLLQSGAAVALPIVVRFTLPAASLALASQNLGAAFGSGELLAAVRAALGPQYAATTLRSTASKHAFRASDGGASQSVIFAGRISSQLVAPEEDPCNFGNGGCHGLVICTADPSNAVTGVICGTCPDGHIGDGTVTGTGCTDVDECTDPARINGGCASIVVCSNTVGGRTCGACPLGYVGDGVTCVDVNECVVANGGCDTLSSCTNTAGGRTCGTCPAGFKGSGDTGCKRESACASNNGGCDPLTTCSDTAAGGSSCGSCPAGSVGSGTSGCVDYDACADRPCADGVHCEDDKAPLMTRKCGNCPPGQLGDGVTCASNPCFLKNGGCDALTSCSATATGGAVCGECPSGYERTNEDQFASCANVDGCALEPCHPGVLCTDVPPPAMGRICGACPTGYQGDGAICTDIDECADVAVVNGRCDTNTTCINVPGSVECGPCPGWALGSGKTGCKPKTTCSVNNGGCDKVTACEDNMFGISCGPCPAGFSGSGNLGCIDIDGCAGNPCFAGVACNDIRAPDLGFTCDPCPEGFSGNGTHCAMCSMGVSIAASTAVDGAVPRRRDTRIIAAATLMASSCSNAAGYVFRWSAARSDGTPVALDPDITKSDTLQLFLPRKSLPPGLSYTLRFEGRQASNSMVTSSVEFAFFVQSAALQATIAGGEVLLREGLPVTLDATASIDPDDETEFEWEFTWMCQEVPAAATGTYPKP